MDLFERLERSLDPLLELVASYVTPVWDFFQDYAYIQAGLIAAAAYFFAYFFAHFIPRLLYRMGKRFHGVLSDDLLALLRFPVFYLSFLGGLILAIRISNFGEPVASVFISILKSLLIAVTATSLYRVVIYTLEQIAKNRHKASLIQPQTLPLFANSALVFFMIAAVHQIFAVWNVDMTALLASAGIAGLAIGMASKDTLSDIIAGVLILTDNPYKMGDFIHLENGTSGTVTQIGIRSTRIKTKDNVEIIIPNSKMGNREVSNESSVSTIGGIRIKLDIRTAQGVKIAAVRRIILAIADNDPEVLQAQKKTLILADFDERFLLFRLLCSVDSPLKRTSTLARLRETIYDQLNAGGIAMGLPQQHSIAISEQPDTPQKIAITTLPDLQQDVHIKEFPNLFSQGTPRKIHDPQPHKMTASQSANVVTTTNNRDDEQ